MYVHAWNSATAGCILDLERCSLLSVFILPTAKCNDLPYSKVHLSDFRLLTQLPKANVVLLRYLFGVLYNIEQQSSSNQMTAYDLSVCIAPSILCPPNTCSLELEDNFIKKVERSLICVPWGLESML